MSPAPARVRPTVFPFTALVGQERLKLGLLLNAINPRIGGVLISGQKGTAKSTAVRALADVLPEIEVVQGCPFRCDPSRPPDLCDSCRDRVRSGERLPARRIPVEVVPLPLNASEDRLAGSLGFERALKSGRAGFRPGLLAEANRNILYIDEVNLLEDHLVDILLDTAVTGINIVQREAVSCVHPSRFVLVATMNPEEGVLRPQLLDRFGLMVTVSGINHAEQRKEIIRRRERFEADPEGFFELWKPEQERLTQTIVAARDLLGTVTISDQLLDAISDICTQNQVAGHRADILMEKSARTLAALGGRTAVEPGDVTAAAQLVLPNRKRELHRIREPRNGQTASPQAPEAPDGLEPERLQELSDERPDSREGEPGGRDKGRQSPAGPPPSDPAIADNDQGEMPSGTNRGKDRIFEVGREVLLSTRDMRFEREKLSRRSGRRRQTRTAGDRRGRYVRATSQRQNDDLAFDATLRAAAPHQKQRAPTELAVAIEADDIREKIRKKNSSALLLFVVDASGSMGTRLMTETKSAILSLLVEAYQKRDRVALVAFKDDSAEVLLPPTNSVELAKKLLEELPTGGRTPLGHGLLLSYQLIRSQLRSNPAAFPLMVLITDGRANVGMDRNRIYEGPAFGEISREILAICELLRKEKKLKTVVIDTEEKHLGSFDRARKLAEVLDAKYSALEEVVSRDILRTVKEEAQRVLGMERER